MPRINFRLLNYAEGVRQISEGVHDLLLVGVSEENKQDGEVYQKLLFKLVDSSPENGVYYSDRYYCEATNPKRKEIERKRLSGFFTAAGIDIDPKNDVFTEDLLDKTFRVSIKNNSYGETVTSSVNYVLSELKPVPETVTTAEEMPIPQPEAVTEQTDYNSPF